MVVDPRVPGESQVEQRGAHTSQVAGAEGRPGDFSVHNCQGNVKHWNRLSCGQRKSIPTGEELRHRKPLQPAPTLPHVHLPEKANEMPTPAAGSSLPASR